MSLLGCIAFLDIKEEKDLGSFVKISRLVNGATKPHPWATRF